MTPATRVALLMLTIVAVSNCDDSSPAGQNVPCAAFTWNCNGHCIPIFQSCNTSVACENEKTGKSCFSFTCFSTTLWKCPKSHQCILQSWRCDGELHCDGGEDENESCREWSCWSDAFTKCADNLQCYRRRDRCNREANCKDESDEIGCFECQGLAVLCDDNSACIERDNICNGRADCRDGSDEQHCADSEGDFWNGCRFGWKGQRCDIVCKECESPWCRKISAIGGTYTVQLHDGACVPASSKSLTFWDSKLTFLDRHVFSYLAKKLDFLKMRNVTFETSSPDFLSDLSVSRLYLISVPLTTTQVSFLNLSRLVDLQLDQTGIDDIPLLLGAGKLARLSLNRNYITAIRGEALVHAGGGLTSLHLRQNRITKLYPNCFVGLDFLQELDLSGNYLTHLTAGRFRPLFRLQALYLEGNDIRFVPALKGLPAPIQIALHQSNCSSFELYAGLTCIPTKASVTTKHFLLQDGLEKCSKNNCSNEICFNLIGGTSCMSAETSFLGAFSCTEWEYPVTNEEQRDNIPACGFVNETFTCRNTFVRICVAHRLRIAGDVLSVELRNVTWSTSDAQKIISKFPNMTSLTLAYQDGLAEKVIVTGRLQNLSVTFSNLKVLPYKVIENAVELKLLNLSHNKLNDTGIFLQASLEVLDLSHNRIATIMKGAFNNVKLLRVLDLSHNNLRQIHLDDLGAATNLEFLSLSSNAIRYYPPDLFLNQTGLRRVYGDSFTICCVAYEFSPELNHCEPEEAISSCNKMISHTYIEVAIWFQAVFATLANFAAVIFRTKEYIRQNGDFKNIKLLLFGTLAGADLFMGLYLFIIAISDQVFKPDFYQFSSYWRSSAVCQAAGVLSLFSAEASVFTLLVITVLRAYSVSNPLTFHSLSRMRFLILEAAAWVLALAISVMPVVLFSAEFFSHSNLCLPPLVHSREASWGYTLFLTILNLLCFTGMLVTQGLLYCSVAAQRPQESGNSKGMNPWKRLGIRVSLLVATDLICWITICAIAFASLAQGESGFEVNDFLYPFVAFILLPINSLINPVIHSAVSQLLPYKKCTSIS